MANHPQILEALRGIADFLDLLSDQAKATSQAIHDAIPDQVATPAATMGLCQDCLALHPFDTAKAAPLCPDCGGDLCNCPACLSER